MTYLHNTVCSVSLCSAVSKNGKEYTYCEVSFNDLGTSVKVFDSNLVMALYRDYVMANAGK